MVGFDIEEEETKMSGGLILRMKEKESTQKGDGGAGDGGAGGGGAVVRWLVMGM